MKLIYFYTRKSNLAFIILIFMICCPGIFSQLFQNTWIGYNIGNYTNARFPYGAVIKDLNGDSALDAAVALWPWSTGFNVVLRQPNGDYSNPVHYNSSLPPLDIISADINKDGMNDIIVPNSGVNWEGNTVAVYMNNGAGSFSMGQEFSTGSGPVGLVAADFNNDSYTDIAVANYGYLGQGSTVSVLINNHSGGFQNQVVVAAGPAPYKLTAGDLNSDNFIDIVAGNQQHKVTVIMNNGSGSFLPGVTYTTNLPQYAGAYYPAVAIADINKDNKPDVLYSNTKTQSNDRAAVVLFHNLGGGVLGNQVPILFNLYETGPSGISAVDFNNDTWVDVAGACNYNSFSVALNNGSGGFLPAEQYPDNERPFRMFAEDMDKDGFMDILTLDNFSMEITNHKNLGNGTFAVPPAYVTTPVGLTLDAADIDLDGDLDIVTSGNGIVAGVAAAVIKNNGDGTFQGPVNYSVNHGTMFAKFKKLNTDIYPDLLFVQNSTYDLCAAMNNGDGTFGTVTIYPIDNCGLRDINAYDIDRDGDLDAVMCEALACPGVYDSGKRLYFAKNNGNGTFQSAYSIVIDPNPYTITSADFNNDNNPDLATAHWGTYGANNWIDVILGNGDGSWQGAVIYQVGQGPNGIVCADFNHDNVLDLATCNSGADGVGIETMSVLFGNPNGTFQTANTYYGSYSGEFLGTTGIAEGDVNNDGHRDIMVSNYGSNDISMYINNGVGTFDFKYRYGAGWGPEWPFYADFTGDSIKDIAASVTISHPGSLNRGVAIIKGNENPLGIDPGNSNNVPTGFTLYQNYPNPFNPVTLIKYYISSNSKVKLTVYDITGKETAVLADYIQQRGFYEVKWYGENFSSGVYFYRLETKPLESKEPGFAETRKMVLLK